MSEDNGPTQFGPIPLGVSFLEATRSSRHLRKFAINPSHHTRRLTLCETLREIWRIADTLPEPQRSALQDLAGAGFDFGKRMNAKLKAYAAQKDAG
jgi:hypothetical protein